MLDWEKAFDKIEHSRLMEALERLQIPKELLDLMGSIYENPFFKVVNEDNQSEYKRNIPESDKAAHFPHTCSYWL